MVFEHLNGETFLIPKLVMTMCGMWPPNVRKRRALIVFVIWSALKIVYAITPLLNPCGKIHLRVSTIATFFFTTSTILSDLSIWMNSDLILRLIESKIDNWRSVTNVKDRQIMKSHQIFGTCYFVISIPLVVVWMVQGMMGIPFVRNVELSNDQQRVLKNCDTWITMTSVLKLVTDFSTALIEIGILMLFWSLNMHLSKEFKILKTRFQKCLRIKRKESSDQVFRRLVDRHNQLLELCVDFKKSFFVFLMVKVFVIQIWICHQAYQVAIGINNGNFMASIARSSVSAMTLWMLFILYNSGELLTTCSEEIADVFYQCKWYNLSKESRTNFTIVILRCRMPVTLTVGGFFKLNNSNYKNLVEGVYSYVSLILAITEPDQ